MSKYQNLKSALMRQPKQWLVTGAAGFIGSHVVEQLLVLGQRVVGLDNFSTGRQANLDDIKSRVTTEQWSDFTLIEGDAALLETALEASRNVDYVLHLAALGSVPRSVKDPLATNLANVGGHLAVLMAARENGVRRVVYSSSSSVYGDAPELPKTENRIGSPLSPYAVTKRVNELYSQAFLHNYGLESVGLRYFNVFGPRQDPNGPYAAVIPKWILSMLSGERVMIHGDGSTSRDFCYVPNVVQANILAATAPLSFNSAPIFNVGLNATTNLLTLFKLIRDTLALDHPELKDCQPIHTAFRPGDILHSQADITQAREQLGYLPAYSVNFGIPVTTRWFQNTRNAFATALPVFA
jgi:UDP-N-acetylglucosamine 4-epimerase